MTQSGACFRTEKETEKVKDILKEEVQKEVVILAT